MQSKKSSSTVADETKIKNAGGKQLNKSHPNDKQELKEIRNIAYTAEELRINKNS